VWFDTTLGVPYSTILGGVVSVSLLKPSIVDAALTVPDVISAVCYLSGINGRQISGQVIAQTASGQAVVNF
jgi:hypothetical protein